MVGTSRMRTSDLKPFVDKALTMGAVGVKVIRTSTIRCAPWVRLKCQFGCGGYDKRLTCPPFTPTPEETGRTEACYKRAILIHADDNDVVNAIVPDLEREIFLGHEL